MIISYEANSLYTSFTKNQQSRLNLDVKQVIEQITKKNIPAGTVTVTLNIGAC